MPLFKNLPNRTEQAIIAAVVLFALLLLLALIYPLK